MKYIPLLLSLSLLAAAGCSPHKDSGILTGEQASGQIDAQIVELNAVAKGMVKTDPTDSAELTRIAKNMAASVATLKNSLANAENTEKNLRSELSSKTTTALLPWIIVGIGIFAVGVALLVWGRVGSALADGICAGGIALAGGCLGVMVIEPALAEFAKIVMVGAGVIVVAILGYVAYKRKGTLAEIGSNLSPAAIQSLSAPAQKVIGAVVKSKALPPAITINAPTLSGGTQ